MRVESGFQIGFCSLKRFAIAKNGTQIGIDPRKRFATVNFINQIGIGLGKRFVSMKTGIQIVSRYFMILIRYDIHSSSDAFSEYLILS